ncbi:hypothetical protein C8J56DRAFT_892341 [Mycena floridula]|nr:hypothetical protein C8J56DRAFT_892341 [Mycena floridula]
MLLGLTFSITLLAAHTGKPAPDTYLFPPQSDIISNSTGQQHYLNVWPEFLPTKFPNSKEGSDSVCISKECFSDACIQPKIQSIGNCIGCEGAYDTTGFPIVELGQITLDEFVANCTQAGFPVSKVNITATKSVATDNATQTNTAQTQTNPSQTQTTNPSTTATDKNAGSSLSARGTMTLVISVAAAALLA